MKERNVIKNNYDPQDPHNEVTSQEIVGIKTRGNVRSSHRGITCSTVGQSHSLSNDQNLRTIVCRTTTLPTTS
jgi:hypothetical protein